MVNGDFESQLIHMFKNTFLLGWHIIPAGMSAHEFAYNVRVNVQMARCLTQAHPFPHATLRVNKPSQFAAVLFVPHII